VRYNCAVLFRMASDPGTPGWPNEDYACIGPGAAVLLDGATTVPRGTDTGCQHGVAWYARTLGTDLLAAITAEPRVSLASGLAAAIAQVRDRHSGTCDLASRARRRTSRPAEGGGRSMSIAANSAPIVVGIRHTSSATSVGTSVPRLVTGFPSVLANSAM